MEKMQDEPVIAKRSYKINNPKKHWLLIKAGEILTCGDPFPFTIKNNSEKDVYITKQPKIRFAR